MKRTGSGSLRDNPEMEKDMFGDTARTRAGQPENDENDEAGTALAPGTAEPRAATAPGSGPVESGPDGQPIGPDNIRDGTVKGVMGGPNQTQGEGQGG